MGKLGGKQTLTQSLSCALLLQLGAFPRQERAFDRKPPVIAPKRPGFPKGTVARDQPADRVAPDCSAHSAHGAGLADLFGDLP